MRRAHLHDTCASFFCLPAPSDLDPVRPDDIWHAEQASSTLVTLPKPGIRLFFRERHGAWHEVEVLIGIDLVGTENRRAIPRVKDYMVDGKGNVRTLPRLAPSQVLIALMLVLRTFFAPVDIMPTGQLRLRDLPRDTAKS